VYEEREEWGVENMVKKDLSLEEAIERFVGQPYSGEIASEIESMGFSFTTLNGKIHRVFKLKPIKCVHVKELLKKAEEAWEKL